MVRAAPDGSTGPNLRRSRLAVSTLFVLNGVAYANVVPRIPELQDRLDLSNTSLGTAVAALPLGALMAGPLAGRATVRWGSGRLAVGCGVGFGLVLPLVGLAPVWGALAGVLGVMGVLDTLMDVAMNTQALRVQRRLGRTAIGSFHALWSAGAVLGGLVGSLAAGARVPLAWHLVLAGAAILVAALWCGSAVLGGSDDTERTDAVPSAGRSPDRRPGGRAALAALGVLGGLLVCGGIVEDSAQTWGAVLLSVTGAAAGGVGLAYAAFQGAMVAGRLLMDRVVDRRGPVAVVRAGALLTALGMAAALLSGGPVAIVAGFALAGLGAAPLFPLVFSAAGELPGVGTGFGVAMVAWLARIGFLLAPPLIGWLGDAADVRTALALVPAAALIVAAGAGALRPRPTVATAGAGPQLRASTSRQSSEPGA